VYIYIYIYVSVHTCIRTRALHAYVNSLEVVLVK